MKKQLTAEEKRKAHNAYMRKYNKRVREGKHKPKPTERLSGLTMEERIEYNKQYQKEYYKKHKDIIDNTTKKNREKYLEYFKAYYKNYVRPQSTKEKNKIAYNKKMQEPEYKKMRARKALERYYKRKLLKDGRS